MAFTLGRLNRPADAEPLNRRALEGRERVLGPDHSDTMTSVANTAVTLGDLDSNDAEPLNRCALEGRRAGTWTRSSRHPDQLSLTWHSPSAV